MRQGGCEIVRLGENRRDAYWHAAHPKRFVAGRPAGTRLYATGSLPARRGVTMAGGRAPALCRIRKNAIKAVVFSRH
jgi:hypothetical protein